MQVQLLQLSGLTVVCAHAERESLATWTAACPSQLVFSATPYPHLISQTEIDDFQQQKRDAISRLEAQIAEQEGGAK